MHYMRERRGADMAAPAQSRTAAVVDGKRRCNTCGVIKSIDEFHRNSKGLGGRLGECRVCRKAKDKVQREQRRDVLVPLKREEARRRRALLRTTVVEDFTTEELRAEQGDQCAYCPKQMLFGVREYHPDKASLDHVVPLSRGGTHTRDNAVLACLECNMSKGDKMLAEWFQWL